MEATTLPGNLTAKDFQTDQEVRLYLGSSAEGYAHSWYS
jgi:hypothetical protein